MALCEVVRGADTDPTAADDAADYLSNVLRRKVIRVADRPAFLANRAGFYVIGEALHLADEHSTEVGVDYVDATVGPFSGRAMAPLATVDFVGLDVTAAILKNLYDNTDDYAHAAFAQPDYFKHLVATGRLGRKSGCGLYSRALAPDGSHRNETYDIAHAGYREKKKYELPFADAAVAALRVGQYTDAMSAIEESGDGALMCLDVLLKYIVYSLNVAEDCEATPQDADVAMAEGFNWCPPLALAEALGGAAQVRALIHGRLGDDFVAVSHADALLAEAPSSQYDYRPYLKVRR